MGESKGKRVEVEYEDDDCKMVKVRTEHRGDQRVILLKNPPRLPLLDLMGAKYREMQEKRKRTGIVPKESNETRRLKEFIREASL